jgi:hypothetical protein
VTPLSVSRIAGEVAEGGKDLLLRIETEGDATDFRLDRSDLGGLVNMLLALAGAEPQPGLELVEGSRPSSLPAACLSLGEAADGQVLLGIEVGAVQLVFSIPREALAQLAYAMLAATAGNRPAT